MRLSLRFIIPLAFVLALTLISQGVVQTFGAYKTVSLLQPTTDANGLAVSDLN